MKQIVICTIIAFLLTGCTGTIDNTQTVRSPSGQAITLVDPAHPDKIQYISVCANYGHTANIRLLYLVSHDGTYIFSKNPLDGGPPYFKGKIPPKEMSQLKNELNFLENVNPDFKYIFRVAPDSDCGFITIIDDQVQADMVLDSMGRLIGFNFPPEENQEHIDKELLKRLQQKGDFNDEQKKNMLSSCGLT